MTLSSLAGGAYVDDTDAPPALLVCWPAGSAADVTGRVEVVGALTRRGARHLEASPAPEDGQERDHLAAVFTSLSDAVAAACQLDAAADAAVTEAHRHTPNPLRASVLGSLGEAHARRVQIHPTRADELRHWNMLVVDGAERAATDPARLVRAKQVVEALAGEGRVHVTEAVALAIGRVLPPGLDLVLSGAVVAPGDTRVYRVLPSEVAAELGGTPRLDWARREVASAPAELIESAWTQADELLDPDHLTRIIRVRGGSAVDRRAGLAALALWGQSRGVRILRAPIPVGSQQLSLVRDLLLELVHELGPVGLATQMSGHLRPIIVSLPGIASQIGLSPAEGAPPGTAEAIDQISSWLAHIGRSRPTMAMVPEPSAWDDSSRVLLERLMIAGPQGLSLAVMEGPDGPLPHDWMHRGSRGQDVVIQCS